MVSLETTRCPRTLPESKGGVTRSGQITVAIQTGSMGIIEFGQTIR